MKKTMLVVFGLGDTFCDTKSHRCIKRGPVLFEQSCKLLQKSKHNFYGVVRVNEPSDTFKEVDIAEHSVMSRVIDVKLCSNSLFDTNNQISVNSSDNTGVTGGQMILDGNQLDHVLPPEEYDLCIAGIDINGVFINLMSELEEMGYNVTVFSDIIKPFSKQTIDTIKRSKVRFGKSS